MATMMTDSHKNQLDELETIERRIKRATDTHELRHVLVLLNNFGAHLGRDSTQVRGYYLFLRGVTHTKGALMSNSAWISSSVESLQFALDNFIDADTIFKEVGGVSWSHELLQLQRKCAYEAMVAVTTLTAWGVEVETIPDTNCLTSEEQQRIAQHQRHTHQLRSRYV